MLPSMTALPSNCAEYDELICAARRGTSQVISTRGGAGDGGRGGGSAGGDDGSG